MKIRQIMNNRLLRYPFIRIAGFSILLVWGIAGCSPQVQQFGENQERAREGISESRIWSHLEESAEALTPEPLQESWAESWWIPRHEEKLEEPGRKEARLLFLGDSITQGWETTGREIWGQWYAPAGAFNLGFSGDRTENVLWRLEHGEVDGLRPDLVVVMIGTNNTGHRMDSPPLIARGVERIIEELTVRLPESKILLLAIFPRGETPDDPMRVNNNRVNELITLLGDEDRVFFRDLNQHFLDEEGNLPESVMPDLLHPNEEGYQIWAEVMEPILDELLGSE
ncbi:MAG: platelet-activating factor acetylhydrolase IB subunit [Balneolaceae bacterium]